jgi:P22 coat protein - gene protein 5
VEAQGTTVPNVYQPQQLLTNKAMRVLKNKLVFLKGVNRDNENLFGHGRKSGNQVLVRLPARAVGRQGEGYAPEAYQETSIAVPVRPLQGMDIDLPSTDWVLNMDNIEREILNPFMAQLVNNIERDCLQIAYRAVANFVGTAGVAPSSTTTILQAGAYLDNEACPDDDTRRMLISPNTTVALVPAFQGLLNPQPMISKIIERGLLAKNTLRFDHYQTQNLWNHTIGTCTGTPLTNGTNQTGSSIITNGWTASAAILKQGDIIEFATVNAVNPMTRALYGGLRHFVVTADVSADGSGNATIPIYPPVIPAPAQFATTDVAVPNAKAVTVFGTVQAGLAALAGTSTTQCLGYHKDAFTFAGIRQRLPKGSTEQAWEAVDPDTGIQLRFVQQYTAVDNVFRNRFDVLYAFAAPYPQLAVRMVSN